LFDAEAPLISAKKQQKKRAISPRVEVPIAKKPRPPLVPPASKQKTLASFNYLFGQQELSATWIQDRERIKDMVAAMMASVRPEGDRDILDWLSVGRAIGSAIEQTISAEAETQAEDSIGEQNDSNDKGEGTSGSRDPM
jgi:hypothetical protein